MGKIGLKTGGRVKGTPNRKTQTLMEQCEAKGIDPWAMLLEFTGPAPMELRFAALKEICNYLYPKRKAVEHSGEISNPYLQMELAELEKLVKEKLKKK
jgi:hypothetical protein